MTARWTTEYVGRIREAILNGSGWRYNWREMAASLVDELRRERLRACEKDAENGHLVDKYNELVASYNELKAAYTKAYEIAMAVVAKAGEKPDAEEPPLPSS